MRCGMICVRCMVSFVRALNFWRKTFFSVVSKSDFPRCAKVVYRCGGIEPGLLRREQNRLYKSRPWYAKLRGRCPDIAIDARHETETAADRGGARGRRLAPAALFLSLDFWHAGIVFQS